jgi:hypothetical protein
VHGKARHLGIETALIAPAWTDGAVNCTRTSAKRCSPTSGGDFCAHGGFKVVIGR